MGLGGRVAGVARAMRCPAFVTAVAFGLAASGCRAESSTGRDASTGAFTAAAVHNLREFGALGDGRADDTAALRRAFANSDRYCLDGEGRIYRVNGTLEAQKNFCLRNAVLVQTLAPFDTSPYIRRSCPSDLDASAVVDCGDPAIPPEDIARLKNSLSVRTLLIRPGQGDGSIRVILDHVKVDRGRYPEGGSRTDSAGIYIQGGDPVDLRNVEVTGSGKGYGLIVLRSRNVNVDSLWVHDLVWAPYPGDTPLERAHVAAIGWNSVPIHEFRPAGRDGAQASKFYGVRVQEQITCALFADVQNVTIRNPRISRCMARFVDGDLPWQTDGLDISRSSSNVVVDAPVIDSTMEGMDVVANGSGIDGLQIRNPRVFNSFTFGLKIGKQLRNPRITNAVVQNAGIAGIVIYGPVVGAVVEGADISGIGTISVAGKGFVPWPRQPHSGIRIDEGTSGTGTARSTPRDVDIENVDVSKGAGVPAYDFGILNKGGTGVRVHGLRVTGFSKAPTLGVTTQ
jgi:hypothetical protein